MCLCEDGIIVSDDFFKLIDCGPCDVVVCVIFGGCGDIIKCLDEDLIGVYVFDLWCNLYCVKFIVLGIVIVCNSSSDNVVNWVIGSSYGVVIIGVYDDIGNIIGMVLHRPNTGILIVMVFEFL